jgi:hypothetical protein
MMMMMMMRMMMMMMMCNGGIESSILHCGQDKHFLSGSNVCQELPLRYYKRPLALHGLYTRKATTLFQHSLTSITNICEEDVSETERSSISINVTFCCQQLAAQEILLFGKNAFIEKNKTDSPISY